MQSLQAQLGRTERVPRRVVQAHAMAISTCRTAGNGAGELGERLNLAESSRQFLPKPQSTHRPSYPLSSFAYATS